jgi:hypothetical protein
MIHLFFKIFLGQHIRWRLSVVLSEFIVNRHLLIGSKEYHITGQGSPNAKHGNIITYGEPWGTVPEVLFEKKGLIPAVQQLFFHAGNT